MIINKKLFSEVLKEKRFELRLSPKQMAEALGIGVSMYGQYERGLWDKTDSVRKSEYIYKLQQLKKEDFEDVEVSNLQDVITQRFAKAYLKLKEAKRLKTHGEVASKIGWDASSISTSLKGERTIPILKAITFCKEYGVNQDWLLEGRGEMFSSKVSITKEKIEYNQPLSGSSETSSKRSFDTEALLETIREKDELIELKEKTIKSKDIQIEQQQNVIDAQQKVLEILQAQISIRPVTMPLKRKQTNEKKK